MLDKLVASLDHSIGRVRLNTFELAIKLLQDEYEVRLSENHFLIAIEFLENQTKASVFITLKGPIRDQWLCKGTGIELLEEAESDW